MALLSATRQLAVKGTMKDLAGTTPTACLSRKAAEHSYRLCHNSISLHWLVRRTILSSVYFSPLVFFSTLQLNHKVQVTTKTNKTTWHPPESMKLRSVATAPESQATRTADLSNAAQAATKPTTAAKIARKSIGQSTRRHVNPPRTS